MEPVPGYAAANWEKGYGDFVMKPDLGDAQAHPWLPGTALVLCDIVDHHHHEPVAAQPAGHVAGADRAARRPEACRAYFASELEFYLFDETYESAEAKALERAQDGRHLYPGLSHLPDHQGGGGLAGDAQRPARRRHPVENSKGEWGPGQEEINVRYAEPLTMADWHVILKNGCKEIAYGLGQGSHLHGQMALRPRRLVEPYPYVAMG